MKASSILVLSLLLLPLSAMAGDPGYCQWDVNDYGYVECYEFLSTGQILNDGQAVSGCGPTHFAFETGDDGNLHCYEFNSLGQMLGTGDEASEANSDYWCQEDIASPANGDTSCTYNGVTVPVTNGFCIFGSQVPGTLPVGADIEGTAPACRYGS